MRKAKRGERKERKKETKQGGCAKRVKIVRLRMQKERIVCKEWQKKEVKGNFFTREGEIRMAYLSKQLMILLVFKGACLAFDGNPILSSLPSSF